uniref:cytochrome c oxidase subunit II n=1 Tax=Gunungiella wangi TaxID=3025506 RepID=UPI002435D040|nr:cytochrome c oxidase subunit II [Gunungiella wangi]WEU80065.1 cytochrome c oxidase subunit II [Gunungiella wangi]
MATWSNIMLQNSNSPLMEELIFFYDHSMIMIILIVTYTLYLIFILLVNKFSYKNFIEHQILESIWTVIPCFFLLFIAIPSLYLLYLMDESKLPHITLKIMGHQWYWSYEYSDFKNIEFNSYISNSPDSSNFRLLDVDNHIVMPFKIQIRSLVSSTDVIHAWTIPSLGVKIDAVPGRLNQINFFINRPGLYFGQCSEICGTNHSFMPITLESINLSNFISWINKN